MAKKLTREELVAEVNKYPGEKLHNRIKREIMIELLGARKFSSLSKWQQLMMILKA